MRWAKNSAMKNQRGTTSLAEYAVTVFLVIAVVTAMTMYVQRTLQARMRDARHYMAKTVGEKCDLYCGEAAGLTTWLVNTGSANFDNTQCGGLTNLDCEQSTGMISVQRVGDQYEPYYAQVSAQVDSEKLRNKKLMASTSASGIFMDQSNAQTQTSSFSNQASPSHARTMDDNVLVTE